MLGLLEPTRGSIECGNRPIADDRAAWYAGLGVVPQEVFLFNDTIASNVAFDVDEGRIDLQSRRAGHRDGATGRCRRGDARRAAHDGRENAACACRAASVSGSASRVPCIAVPSVLVLDEATSALDNATEHEISETLATLAGTMTILIVAHRLSTVRHADTLVFLKEGRIDARGTFEEVCAASADFAHLVELGRLD